jgi:hypothetical protein
VESGNYEHWSIMFNILLAATLMAGPVAATDNGGLGKIGYAESLYTGKWYSKTIEPVRKCIMYRESRFNYKAANKTSSARGAYQFLDRSWRVSLTWMLMPEHKKHKSELISLRSKPIHEWSRYWQDAAFFTVWRFGEGRKHWNLQANQCW